MVLLVLLSSCAAHKAKVIDGRYYDREGWFSVEVPETPFDQTIEEKKLEFTHIVRFQNEIGQLTSIAVLKNPDMQLAYNEDADFLENTFDIYFKSFSQTFPGMRVFYREKDKKNLEKHILQWSMFPMHCLLP